MELIPITDANLIVVFLIYGAALFAVGLSTALEVHWAGDRSALGVNLWALSGFALLHAVAEWVQMLSLVARHGTDIPGQDHLAPASTLLMLVSFLFLFYFGVSFLAAVLRRPRLYLLLPVLVLAWLGGSFWLSLSASGGQADWTVYANIFGRYFLYLPGAMLAAIALAHEGGLQQKVGAAGVGRSYRRAGLAFAFSAGLSGLVVPAADFFPASALNYTTFAATTGLPVAVFRAALALVTAYFILSAMRGLDAERRRKLELANEQLQRLTLQVLGAQEEERKRIARELHDETVQLLSLLLMRLKMAQRQSDPEERERRLEGATQLALEAADGLRRIARDLRPPAIDDLGLVAALEWHAHTYRTEHGLEIDFLAEDMAERPAPEVELVLYRVAQEALTNVVKHARARRVSIRLRRSAQAVTALVEDDGLGFDLEAVRMSPRSGMGLFGMAERASVLGAKLTVNSRPGAGTQVRVEVPVGVAYG